MASPSVTTSPATGYHIDVAVALTTKKPDLDKIIRIQHAFLYFKYVWYLVASFIALISICHFVLLFRKIARPNHSKVQVRERGTVSLKRLPTAILDTFKVFAFRWTVPIGQSHTLNVAEVFLSAIYATVLFVFSLMHSTNTKGEKYDPHYWANIAGNIICTQLPLMTALGMRNNIISLLTGVSFDKLNYLHRMSGRVICVLIWVHASGRIKLGLTGSDTLATSFIRCGLLAGTSLTLLSIISIRPLREARYEVFLVVHFVLAFIVLLGAYFHVQHLDLGYFIFPSFALWAFDRLLRLLRMAILNAGYLKSKWSKEMDARVDVLSPHLLRISVKRPNYVHWRPGQSVFITFPSISFLEAHPFTISTLDVPYAAPPVFKENLESSEIQENFLKKELVFLTQVRRGFTKRLLTSASNSDKQAFRIILDGPYSSPPLLVGYRSVVLISGGSGITFILPLFLDLVHRAKEGKVSYCRIVLVWAIKSSDLIGWISDVLSGAVENLPATISLTIKIFVTDTTIESMDEDSEAKSSSHASEPSILYHSFVHVSQGRPDIKALINGEIKEAEGPISVNVCGPCPLVNTVRNALKVPRFLDVLRGGPTITLHVEAFGT